MRAIDQAAACMYELQHEVLAAQGIPVQGIGREASFVSNDTESWPIECKNRPADLGLLK